MKKIIKREIITDAQLNLREAEGDANSRTISGYAILFNSPSVNLYDDGEYAVREVIAPEAVTREFLDANDIKMTMFHDRQLILARSKNGEGTLTYSVDDKGVAFEFEAPATADGDKAVELVRRGDISGCSFAFSTYYDDGAYVEREVSEEDGKSVTTCTVKKMVGIYDMTLAADPAYPDAECWARELVEREDHDEEKENINVRSQIDEIRQEAAQPL